MVTQENATTTAATPAAADSADSKHSTGEDRFKYGVIIRGKFIGVEDVKEDHGDEICRTSMIKLKALVLAKKEHKQRICVRITLDGVEILDERTNTPMFNHAVTKISYIARDVEDSRAIGYIYKNAPNSYQYFAIKTLGQAQELFNTLKELFEVVLDMRTRAKQLKQQQQPAASEPVEAKKDEPAAAAPAPAAASEPKTPDDEIVGLEDKIKQMNQQPQPSLLDMNSDPNNLVSSFEGTLTIGSENNEPPKLTQQKSASDELFSLMDPATNAPTPQENALSILKSQISNIQAYSMPPQQRMAPVPPQGMMVQNPFGAPTMSPPAMSQPNPFGNMGVGMGVPLTNFPAPGGVPPQQQGFISPNPNVFSSHIPNPHATVNPNPSSSQLPW